ncbi:MAG: FAD-dependent oxidoreductase [Lachnospiraceae bacterium]
MESIWKKETQIPERESLQENTTVHTVVIGAGMAGILIAYFLKKEGKDVIVVEADRIAGGQTGNTTAKITAQHGLCYAKMIKNAGEERAKGYAMANKEAIRLYEKIIGEEKISCDLQKLPSYLYSVRPDRTEELKEEAKAAARLGIDAGYVEGNSLTDLPFEIAGAVCFHNQAQFQPLRFLKHLAGELTVYEHTRVLSVKKHEVFTDKGTITAENIVFATHYPFPIVPGFYFLRQHQERSYVLALPNKKEINGMYYSVDEGGLSFRKAGNMLLVGGGSHRTGKSSCKKGTHPACTGEGFHYLRKMAGSFYPNLEEAAHWAAQDSMTHDSVPFIGKFSTMRPYWYIATGFNKWGMTASMIAAMILSDSIQGRENAYAGIFKPQRFLFRASVKNLLTDVGQSIVGLSKGLFGNKDMRCPHMGCRLTWNTEEESFDCPCHGSRFDRNGNLIDNPAQTSLYRNEKYR